MKQINFRLSDEEYKLVEELAKVLDKSVPALLKELGMKEINTLRLRLAIDLYSNNKIGLKKAWKLSHLPFIKFLQHLNSKNIEPNITDELDDKMVNLALDLRFNEIFSGKSREELRKILYGSE
ncbi:MAG: hypothetical protein HWN67_03390 [Candidatus Helarchaeota archaeon]|nr:hypothetical protein [Candidatus Helarchaeota archaeon]